MQTSIFLNISPLLLNATRFFWCLGRRGGDLGIQKNLLRFEAVKTVWNTGGMNLSLFLLYNCWCWCLSIKYTHTKCEIKQNTYLLSYCIAKYTNKFNNCLSPFISRQLFFPANLLVRQRPNLCLKTKEKENRRAKFKQAKITISQQQLTKITRSLTSGCFQEKKLYDSIPVNKPAFSHCNFVRTRRWNFISRAGPPTKYCGAHLSFPTYLVCSSFFSGLLLKKIWPAPQKRNKVGSSGAPAIERMELLRGRFHEKLVRELARSCSPYVSWRYISKSERNLRSCWKLPSSRRSSPRPISTFQGDQQGSKRR